MMSWLSLELSLGLVVNGTYFMHKLQKQVVGFLLQQKLTEISSDVLIRKVKSNF